MGRRIYRVAACAGPADRESGKEGSELHSELSGLRGHGLGFRCFTVSAWPRLNAFHAPLSENTPSFLRQALTL